MKKIDWYILKKFLVTFIFCMLLFTVIAVAVDSSEKADDFVTAGFSTKEIILISIVVQFEYAGIS